MENPNQRESGYFLTPESEYGLESYFMDIEVIRVSRYNLIARGKRYGRWWLLKGLPPGKTDSTSLLHRLKKEFELHSRLRHPAIPLAVAIEEVPEFGPMMVMEWIEGETLADALNSHPLKRKEARSILSKIVEALKYIHSKGITHRDLKPSNIMIRRSGGEIALIDFGLADSDDYTALKQGAGTPGFASPEQITSESTDTSDDIFSLGMLIRQLCPDMKRLARKCTAPKTKRPKDAEAVEEIINRQKNLPRLILYSIIVVLCGVSAFLLYRLSVISDSSLNAGTRFLEMEKATDNMRREAVELKDSLSILNQRLHQNESLTAEARAKQMEAEQKQIEAERTLQEITDKQTAKENFIIKSQQKLDNLFKKWHNKIYPGLTSNDSHRFAQLMGDLGKERETMFDSFTSELKKTSISEGEQQQILSSLLNYYMTIYNKYYQQWAKKVYPHLNLSK